MIDYEIGSSPVGVYTMTKTSPAENFKHGWKNDNKGSSLEVEFHGQPRTLGQET
jgi:hypothetical protein